MNTGRWSWAPATGSPRRERRGVPLAGTTRQAWPRVHCKSHHVKQPISFPRPHFCVRALPLCFTHPPLRGGRSAERRSGARRNTRGRARNAARQALARRLASHDAGRSPLGAPPWRFWAPGAALLSPLPPSACASAGSGSDPASSSQPGRNAWRAGSLPPGAAVTSRHRRTPHLAPPSGCLRTAPLKERGCESCSTGAICSQERS
jgi:hypothetical protein